MKVLACGDRYYRDRRLVFFVLSQLYVAARMTYDLPFVLIEGQCPYGGADNFAAEWAICMQDQGVRHMPEPAKWSQYGRKAGPIRNSVMLTYSPDLVVAFHDAIAKSKGTKDMVDKAVRANVPAWLVRHEGAA